AGLRAAGLRRRRGPRRLHRHLSAPAGPLVSPGPPWDHQRRVTSAACLALVDAAARAALEPLGLARLDRSTWIDDHGWWVVAVDFETVGVRGTRLVLYAD